MKLPSPLAELGFIHLVAADEFTCKDSTSADSNACLRARPKQGSRPGAPGRSLLVPDLGRVTSPQPDWACANVILPVSLIPQWRPTLAPGQGQQPCRGGDNTRCQGAAPPANGHSLGRLRRCSSPPRKPTSSRALPCRPSSRRTSPRLVMNLPPKIGEGVTVISSSATTVRNLTLAHRSQLGRFRRTV
jgi:hypothetical protein